MLLHRLFVRVLLAFVLLGGTSAGFAQEEPVRLPADLIGLVLYDELVGIGIDVRVVECPRGVGDVLIRPGSGCVYFADMALDAAAPLMSLIVDLYFERTLSWTRDDWMPVISSAFPLLERPIETMWGQRFGLFLAAPSRYREVLLIVADYR